MKTFLCLLLFILGMTTYSTGQITASVSNSHNKYNKNIKYYEKPKNLKVINLRSDYSPFRVDKILRKFSKQLSLIDTEMTFYLLSQEWTSDVIKKEIQNEIETLTGNESILYLVHDRKGNNTECMLILSKDMDRTIRRKLEKLDACGRLNQ